MTDLNGGIYPLVYLSVSSYGGAFYRTGEKRGEIRAVNEANYRILKRKKGAKSRKNILDIWLITKCLMISMLCYGLNLV